MFGAPIVKLLAATRYTSGRWLYPGRLRPTEWYLPETARPDGQSGGRGRLYCPDFLLLWLAYFCHQLTFNIAVPVLPLYTVQVGGTSNNVGLVYGATTLSALPVRLASGVLLDRYGRKPLLLGGAATYLLAVLSFNWAVSAPLPGGARFLQGLGYGAFSGAAAFVADLAPPGRRGEALGVYFTGGSIAQALVPTVGLLVYAAGGFAPVVALATVGASVSVGAAALICETHARPPAPAPARVGSRPTPGNLLVRAAILPGFLQLFVSGCSASILAFVPLHATGVGLKVPGPSSPSTPSRSCSHAWAPAALPTGLAARPPPCRRWAWSSSGWRSSPAPPIP
jgi:MFS family permease